MDVSQLLKWDTEEPKKGQEKGSSQLTDKLIEKLFYMVLPPSMTIDSGDLLKDRLIASSERPPLSIPVMSKNFIQLNSRLSAPFILVNNVIYFLQWKNPFLTITILLLYTNLVIHPIPVLLLTIPLLILHSMATNFMTSYKPDSISNELSSVKIQKVDPLKPASELSKEFILNLTDLQNHMLLYVDAWDFIVHLLNNFINWENQTVSTLTFLVLVITSILTVTFSEHLLPLIQPVLRLTFICIGWGAMLFVHPKFYDAINQFIYSESTRLYILKKTNKLEEFLSMQIESTDVDEVKKVKIFEVWKLNELENEWNFIGFRNSAFWQNDVHRIRYETDRKTTTKPKRNSALEQDLVIEDNDRGRNESFDEESNDVKDSHSKSPQSTHYAQTSLNKIEPPVSWKYKPNSNWRIDMSPDTWLSEDLLTENFESIKIDYETKWVYDNVQGARFKYRRRQWIREVIRMGEYETEPTQADKEELALPIEKKEGDAESYRLKASKTLSLGDSMTSNDT